MWSSYRLGYLAVAAVVMGAVVFVSAEAEHGRTRAPLDFSAILSVLGVGSDEGDAAGDGTEKGNLSEVGATELLREGDYLTALVVSRTKPVLVFKHSTECSISGAAYRRTAEWVRERDDAAPPVFLVKVIEHRTISEFIAKQTNVKHESPQAILLHKGRAVWNTSHEAITAEALNDALAEAAPDADAETPQTDD